MGSPPYVRPDGDGTRLDVFVQPKAVREGIVGIQGDALKLKVRAPAEEGKANRALIELLARTLDVSRSSIEIVSGHSSRRKRVRLSSILPAEVERRLAGLIGPQA